MKQMIQRMREEKGGFTLAELLIVVAIVAVLVAIAIPVFSAQMAKANAAVDEANIRSGYAQAQTFVLMKEDSSGTAITDNAIYYLQTDGTLAGTSGDKDYKTKGAGTDVDDKPSWMPSWAANTSITYTFTVPATGAITFVVGPDAASGGGNE